MCSRYMHADVAQSRAATIAQSRNTNFFRNEKHVHIMIDSNYACVVQPQQIMTQESLI